MRITLDIQNISATTTVGVTVKTYKATVTESEYAAMGTVAGVRSWNLISQGSIDARAMSILEIEATSSTLSVYNGGVAGTRLDYQEYRMAQMYGYLPHINTFVVAGGHNHGTQTPEEFVTAVARFVDVYLAPPESKILVFSQNPQKAPSDKVEAHAARQAAIRQWTTESGHEHVPAYRIFKAQPDGGDSLIITDGIHPTVPPLYTTDLSGATVWAQVLADMLDARRFI